MYLDLVAVQRPSKNLLKWDDQVVDYDCTKSKVVHNHYQLNYQYIMLYSIGKHFEWGLPSHTECMAKFCILS